MGHDEMVRRAVEGLSALAETLHAAGQEGHARSQCDKARGEMAELGIHAGIVAAERLHRILDQAR